MRTLAMVIVAAILGGCAPAAKDYGALFDEMTAVAVREFYDPAAAEEWAAGLAADSSLRDRLASAASGGEFGDIARGALARLGASHTTLYTPGDARYYELLDIFFQGDPPAETARLFPQGEIAYTTAGVLTERAGGRVFAATVLGGGPAANAGIRRGDELVSAGAEPWDDLAAFVGKAGDTVEIGVRRAAGGPVERVSLVPERMTPRASFLRAIRAGSRVIELGGVRVLHVPVVSYAGAHYHDAVKEVLAGELGASADALVLDLRGGWGGASPEYLDIFNPLTPTVGFRPRGERGWRTFTPGWHKPVALLIDGGSRSGKEMLAHAFQEHGIGPVIGSRSAGAVLAGSVRVLSDGSALYVAVGEATINGVRLEGAGVTPDIEVDAPLPFAGGADPALERAVRVLSEQCQRPSHSGD